MMDQFLGLIRNEVGELKNELVGSNIMVSVIKAFNSGESFVTFFMHPQNSPKNQSPADEAKNKADNERR